MKIKNLDKRYAASLTTKENTNYVLGGELNQVLMNNFEEIEITSILTRRKVSSNTIFFILICALF